MKKVFASVLLVLMLISCDMINPPMKAYVFKNTSDKSISFTAGVWKYNIHQVVTNSFTVKPHDSLIFRQTSGFVEVKIFPVDSIEMNDPNVAENWVKSEKEGIPIYTFTINK